MNACLAPHLIFKACICTQTTNNPKGRELHEHWVTKNQNVWPYFMIYTNWKEKKTTKKTPQKTKIKEINPEKKEKRDEKFYLED